MRATAASRSAVSASICVCAASCCVVRSSSERERGRRLGGERLELGVGGVALVGELVADGARLLLERDELEDPRFGGVALAGERLDPRACLVALALQGADLRVRAVALLGELLDLGERGRALRGELLDLGARVAAPGGERLDPSLGLGVARLELGDLRQRLIALAGQGVDAGRGRLQLAREPVELGARAGDLLPERLGALLGGGGLGLRGDERRGRLRVLVGDALKLARQLRLAGAGGRQLGGDRVGVGAVLGELALERLGLLLGDRELRLQRLDLTACLGELVRDGGGLRARALERRAALLGVAADLAQLLLELLLALAWTPAAGSRWRSPPGAAR